MGGGAVCALAGQRGLAALALSSTFTSVRAFASDYFMPGFLVLDPFDNEAALGAYDGPVLIFHGERDDLIPFEQAKALEAAAPDATLVPWDCQHNDCPPDWGAFGETLFAWLVERGIVTPG